MYPSYGFEKEYRFNRIHVPNSLLDLVHKHRRMDTSVSHLVNLDGTTYLEKYKKRQPMKNKDSLLKSGRILLFIPATLYTLLILWVISLFLIGGGDDFMLTDFDGAWIMLTRQFPNVAEDFLHFVKGNLITSLGIGLFSLTILKFAFKHRERWAWFIMWLLPASMIEDILNGISKRSGFECFFGGLVTLAVLGLLIAFRAFFPREIN